MQESTYRLQGHRLGLNNILRKSPIP